MGKYNSFRRRHRRNVRFSSQESSEKVPSRSGTGEGPYAENASLETSVPVNLAVIRGEFLRCEIKSAQVKADTRSTRKSLRVPKLTGKIN